MRLDWLLIPCSGDVHPSRVIPPRCPWRDIALVEKEQNHIPYFWRCYPWIQPHFGWKGSKNPPCLPALFKNITLFYIVIYHPGKPLLGQQTCYANTLFCSIWEFFPQIYITFFPLQVRYHKLLLSFVGQVHISKSQAALQWFKSLKIPQFWSEHSEDWMKRRK